MKGFTMKTKLLWTGLLLAGTLSLHGCGAPQATQDLLAPTDAQMKLRSLQTRSFDLKDRNAAIRGVIASLQDLGFIIERANEGLGLVSAARFAEPNSYALRWDLTRSSWEMFLARPLTGWGLGTWSAMRRKQMGLTDVRPTPQNSGEEVG